MSARDKQANSLRQPPSLKAALSLARSWLAWWWNICNIASLHTRCEHLCAFVIIEPRSTHLALQSARLWFTIAGARGIGRIVLRSAVMLGVNSCAWPWSSNYDLRSHCSLIVTRPRARKQKRPTQGRPFLFGTTIRRSSNLFPRECLSQPFLTAKHWGCGPGLLTSPPIPIGYIVKFVRIGLRDFQGIKQCVNVHINLITNGFIIFIVLHTTIYAPRRKHQYLIWQI